VSHKISVHSFGDFNTVDEGRVTPERWQQIREVLEKALSLTPEQRSAFLGRACASDASLRQEVETLLASRDGVRSSFLEAPAAEQFASRLTASSISGALSVGAKLGPYVVQALLGAGGMGEVYRARDTRLGRTVAIKVVPAHLCSAPQRRQRFEREARAISALQHPNICTLYDVGQQDGTEYLVMEYLEGESLASRIRQGPLPLDLALRYATEVADALDTAHRRGIVHRDLKPANIFITAHGESKVLDFGLAKLEEQTVDGETPTAVETSPEVLTTPGTAMGTVAYMSPEQARGEDLDGRTDIFSLGAVLYEVTTGRLPFPGRTSALVFNAILTDTPKAPSEWNRSLPAQLDGIVRKALEKDRNQRYQHASDLLRDLQQLKRDTESGRISVPVSATQTNPADQRRRLWRIIAPAVVVLIALVAGGVYYRLRRGKPPLTDKDTIVLADFDNKTGDPVFDDTLKTALSVSLNQSPFLNVLSDSAVAKTLKLMTRPPDTKLTPDVVRELCQRAGSKAYIAGSIASLGSQYVLGLKAVNCQSGEVQAQEQATAAGKEKVLNTLGILASKLRGELGESLASVQKLNVPLGLATTSSLEALRVYSLGEKAFRESGASAALPFHRHAIELDPNFAMAYLEVGGDYLGMAEQGRASEYFTRAFELREHTSEWEKLYITATYYENVTGELDKAANTYKEWLANYPRSTAHTDLANVYLVKGQFEKSVEEYLESVRLFPDEVPAYAGLSEALLNLQRFDEARQRIQQAQARKIDDSALHFVLYGLAFLRTDAAAMADQQQWFAGQPEENAGFSLASDTEAYAGHLNKARELTKRSVDSAIHADSKETGAIWLENSALREVAFGNLSDAKLATASGLKLDTASQGTVAEAALAYAMAGDTARAESLAQDLNKRYPLNTQMQSLWLPAIQAQLALNRKNGALALDTLQTTSTIEFGSIPSGLNGSCLYSTYIRGEAYLAAGQGKEAAAEFQKILDHSGIVWNCWTGALAHLGVARANALQAKTSQGADADAARVRALAAYKDFLTLWKDADPDIPILKQAKAEYAKLQ
jgi:eukaryotic-like serine/threonine-protein kinase